VSFDFYCAIKLEVYNRFIVVGASYTFPLDSVQACKMTSIVVDYCPKGNVVNKDDN
jgi:hypothetical protein